MAARQPCAARADRLPRGAPDERWRQASGLGARSSQHLRVPRPGSRGCQSARRRVPVCGAAHRRRRAHDHDHPRDARAAVEHGRVVSRGLLCNPDHRGSRVDSAAGLGVRFRPRGRCAQRQLRVVQAHLARDAGRFARVCRTLLSQHRARSDGPPGYCGGHARELRHDQAGADRGAPQAGAGILRAVRNTPLRSLRDAVGPERSLRGYRPRASSFERKPAPARLFLRLGPGSGESRVTATRVYAFVERQVPAPGGACDTQLQCAHAQ